MKQIKYWIGLCVAIFVIGIVGSILILQSTHGTMVNVIQDGNVLYSFDLLQAKNQTLEIVYEGRANIIEINEGKIRVSEAECPDHSCIRMGYLKSNALPLVCLPNRLIIQFANENDDVDAVVR
jgi:hypothetical protein